MRIIECTDYDSMGNHGRFPIKKKTKSIRQKLIDIYNRFKR